MLYAVEIMGGGTIAAASKYTEKFHWSPGSKSYDTCERTFSSTTKIMIGGTIINVKCPLDETESFHHPGTNGYLRHLGTDGGGWELQEKQAAIQGGQYCQTRCAKVGIKWMEGDR
jgi:hypothetical protein